MYLMGITLLCPEGEWIVLPCFQQQEGRTVHPLSVISHCDITDCEVSVAVQRGANSPSTYSRETERVPVGIGKSNRTFGFSSPRLIDHAIAVWTAPIETSAGAVRRSNADFPHSNVDGTARPPNACDGRIRSRRAPPEALRG
jgi:hypothetical protein